MPRWVSLSFACTHVSHSPGAAPSFRHAVSPDRSATSPFCRLAVRGEDRVQVGALAGLRVGVDQGSRQAGQRVHEVVLGVNRDFVGLDGGDVAATDPDSATTTA